MKRSRHREIASISLVMSGLDIFFVYSCEVLDLLKLPWLQLAGRTHRELGQPQGKAESTNRF